jgi:hypothetical protein
MALAPGLRKARVKASGREAGRPSPPPPTRPSLTSSPQILLRPGNTGPSLMAGWRPAPITFSRETNIVPKSLYSTDRRPVTPTDTFPTPNDYLFVPSGKKKEAQAGAP